MSTTPTLDGRILGLAHHATRAVLEQQLASTGTTFRQSVALTAMARAGGALLRSHLVAQLTDGLKLDASAALATVGELVDAGLVQAAPGADPRLEFTAAGTAHQDRLAEIATGIGRRVYADIPTDDLATAARVLTLVTQRANAELASAEG
ncbi:hypothetical protein ACPFP2_26590 [Micromonospora citrea]|uniref:hypothetical protein n=1 Tax=Micromonospora citrea TaxID=47855 RepID=UPI003C4BF429